MSKFDEAVAKYSAAMTDKLGMSVDADLLRKVAKGLGPSIYNKDSQMVSCSDQSELDRVKTNFLMKKLGLADGPELMDAINDVCKTTGPLKSAKYRAIFYYLLVQKFGKEDVYS